MLQCHGDFQTTTLVATLTVPADDVGEHAALGLVDRLVP
jgi:hypothetical protein